MSSGGAADVRARNAARESAQMALSQQRKQQELAKASTERYEKGFAKQLEQISGLTGATLPQYIERTGKEFSDFYNTKGGELRQSIGSFQPNLLNSESSRLASQAYRQMLGEYESNLGNLAAGVTQRLQSVAEEAPERVFSRLSRNPAFNLQRDPEAMRLAGKPPTMRSDVESMKNLYTYNV